MSSEVLKKRGRPKKIATDPLEVEVIESPKKVTTRAKSTATKKKASTTTATTQKIPLAAEPVAKTVSNLLPPRTAPAQSSAVQQSSKVEHDAPAAPAKTAKSAAATVTPETSKILSQVRELSAMKSTPPTPFAKNRDVLSKSALPTPQPTVFKTSTPPAPQKLASATTPSTNAAKTQPPKSPQNPPPNPAQPPPHSSPATTPPPSSLPPKVPNPPPNALPKIPLAALNSTIVDNISKRAGARPNTHGTKRQLPPNYRPVARKVTRAIVALPIFIVTSWVLYQRCEFPCLVLLFWWVLANS